ncbi:MAG: adenosylmethionine decarboxylase [Candidatus Wildermuthbacteria bacterium]|nr:adenosylmethionine decarboxylase [Candidatus Wildermuthbacteria bacterium]
MAGTHIIADFWFGKQVEDAKELHAMFIKAAKAAGATLLKVSIHAFSPHGITGTALLSESHIMLHTWPEINYTALDVFTCGKANPRKAIRYFQRTLKPTRAVIQTILRGEKKQFLAGARKAAKTSAKKKT